MNINDPIADMLARIRNAHMRSKASTSVPASKLRAWVLDVLKNEGYIRGYTTEETAQGHKNLIIELKYYEGQPVIKEMKRISKPGRRVYANSNDLPHIRQGLGIAIISTSKGVMTDADARNANIGGEVLCSVF